MDQIGQRTSGFSTRQDTELQQKSDIGVRPNIRPDTGYSKKRPARIPDILTQKFGRPDS